MLLFSLGLAVGVSFSVNAMDLVATGETGLGVDSSSPSLGANSVANAELEELVAVVAGVARTA